MSQLTRRQFIGGTVTATTIGLAGCSSSNSPNNTTAPTNETDNSEQEFVSEENAPEKVVESKPLAEDVYTRLNEFYDDPTVQIRRSGEIVVVINNPNSESPDGIEREIKQIAKEYLRVVRDGEYEGETFTVVIGQVSGVLPQPAVRAYAKGELEQDATLETLGYLPVERASDE